MNIDWQSVTLVLGIVGLAEATVCFAIWMLRQPPQQDNYPDDPGLEDPTATWKVPGQ